MANLNPNVGSQSSSSQSHSNVPSTDSLTKIPNPELLLAPFLDGYSVSALSQVNQHWRVKNDFQKLGVHSLVVSALLHANPMTYRQYSTLQAKFGTKNIFSSVHSFAFIQSWRREASLQEISEKMPLLQKVSMSHKDDIHDLNENIQYLNKLALKSLDLKGCKLRVENYLPHLSGLTTLEYLALPNIHHENLTNSGLIHLSGLISLQSLNLSTNCLISNEGLVHLSGLMALKDLNLSFCFNISDKGLLHLSCLTALQSLDISNCFENQISLSSLSRLNLQRLSISPRVLSPVEWSCLGTLPLKHLHLVPDFRTEQRIVIDKRSRVAIEGLLSSSLLPRLTSLNLSKYHTLTDTDLAHLAERATSLTSLSLQECQRITDTGVSILGQQLTSLLELDVHECRGVSEQVQKLV